MRTIKILSIVFILFIADKVSAQQITRAELQVTGLTCSMCSQATEKSLKTLDFIDAITPDLNNNTFILNFRKNKPVSADLIRKKVKDAGFSIGNLTVTFNFNNVKTDDQGQTQIGSNVYKFLNAKGKTLNGEVKATLVDKDFISGAASKKKAAQFKTDTYASGYGAVGGKKTRIYHLTI